MSEYAGVCVYVCADHPNTYGTIFIFANVSSEKWSLDYTFIPSIEVVESEKLTSTKQKTLFIFILRVSDQENE